MNTEQQHVLRVNVHDLVHRPGEMREFDLNATTDEKWGEGIVAVPAGSAVPLAVRFESVHEGILVTAEGELLAVGECGRCLRDIEERVEVEIQELFAYPGEDASEYEVHDDHVDLEPLLRDAVVLSLPFQPVCQPDCPGLDPETGERRPADRASEPPQTIDPRWAALAGFTTDNSSGAPDAADREER